MIKSKTKQVIINRKKMQSVRFAGNIAIVTENECDLNSMLASLSIILEEFKLKVNTKSTINLDKHNK